MYIKFLKAFSLEPTPNAWDDTILWKYNMYKLMKVYWARQIVT